MRLDVIGSDMHAHTTDRCARRGPEATVAGVVSMGVLVVAFGMLALGIEWFWIAFPIGYGAILPLSVGLARRGVLSRDSGESAEETESDEDPLSALKQRYVEGDIDDEQFEAELERVVADE